MKQAAVLALAALLLTVAGCSGETTEQPAETAAESHAQAGFSDDDRAAISATVTAFQDNVNAADWAAIAALYTEDAVLMPPQSPSVTGRAAIQAYFEAFPPLSDFVLVVEEIEGEGDMAYVRGVYTMNLHLAEGAEPVADKGKFLEVRQRQADGTWLMTRDLFNSDIAPPAE